MDNQHLLPADKFDNSNIDKLKALHDEEIRPLIPELLIWLQDFNWPVAEDVLSVLLGRENLVFPLVEEILISDDVMWKAWIMHMLIPHFSDEHKADLKETIEELTLLSSSDEDTQCVIEAAVECYKKCY